LASSICGMICGAQYGRLFCIAIFSLTQRRITKAASDKSVFSTEILSRASTHLHANTYRPREYPLHTLIEHFWSNLRYHWSHRSLPPLYVDCEIDYTSQLSETREFIIYTQKQCIISLMEMNRVGYHHRIYHDGIYGCFYHLGYRTQYFHEY